MMKTRWIAALCVLALGARAQTYMGAIGKIAFFSETRLENIDATNTVAKPVRNAATGEFVVRASQNTFIFKFSFMQERYNANLPFTQK